VDVGGGVVDGGRVGGSRNALPLSWSRAPGRRTGDCRAHRIVVDLHGPSGPISVRCRLHNHIYTRHRLRPTPHCTPPIAMATEADAVPDGQLPAAAAAAAAAAPDAPDVPADSAQKQPVKRSWRYRTRLATSTRATLTERTGASTARCASSSRTR
jgi:hypothetical protein